MSDLKIKTAAKKPPLGIRTIAADAGAARVRAYGARKYEPGNYLLATLADGAAERYVGALLRHVGAMQEPNGLFTRASLARLDEESGLPHVDHALCSLEMLRQILTKEGVLPEDPGEGREPPKASAVTDEMLAVDEHGAPCVASDKPCRRCAGPKERGNTIDCWPCFWKKYPRAKPDDRPDSPYDRPA